jgi:tetratricopeptide (TPR) repeat protein
MMSSASVGRRRRTGVFSCSLLAVLVSASGQRALAQDGQEWVGKRVITKSGAVLRVGKQIVEGEDAENLTGGPTSGNRLYRVERVNDTWLWLQDENSTTAGWVKSDGVIPFEEAIDYFTSEIVANPNGTAAYLRRARVWRLKQEFDKAIADYNAVIRIDPKSAQAYSDRGDAWLVKREFDKAFADFSEAIRLDPRRATAYTARGNIWCDREKYDKAIADYSEALRLAPQFVLAYVGRGQAWLVQGEYDRAIAEFTRAVQLDARCVPAYYNRGIAWSDKIQDDKAIADYGEVIRLDPNHAPAYLSRGNVWYAKSEYEKAIVDYDAAIRLDPKNTGAFFNRSLAQVILHRAQAVAGFKSVVDIQGGKGDLSTYAVILAHLAARLAGDEAQAKTILAEAPAKLKTRAWPYPVVKLLRREIDERTLLAEAIDDEDKTDARCFVGLDHELSDRKNKAIVHFRWVRDHGNPASVLYVIALAELERLEKPDAKPASGGN